MVIGLLLAKLMPMTWILPPKMKMTTQDTRRNRDPGQAGDPSWHSGFDRGVPDATTAQKIYDNLDFQRAVQDYLSSIQIASMEGMRKGILKWGPANTTALLFENLMDSTMLFLTPNTTSIYMLSWIDMTDGPMVIETPPNMTGLIDDAWFHYVADFGQVGPDKYKGGKFLMVPPDYKGEIPEGYFVKHSQTCGNWVI